MKLLVGVLVIDQTFNKNNSGINWIAQCHHPSTKLD